MSPLQDKLKHVNMLITNQSLDELMKVNIGRNGSKDSETPDIMIEQMEQDEP